MYSAVSDIMTCWEHTNVVGEGGRFHTLLSVRHNDSLAESWPRSSEREITFMYSAVSHIMTFWEHTNVVGEGGHFHALLSVRHNDSLAESWLRSSERGITLMWPAVPNMMTPIRVCPVLMVKLGSAPSRSSTTLSKMNLWILSEPSSRNMASSVSLQSGGPTQGKTWTNNIYTEQQRNKQQTKEQQEGSIQKTRQNVKNNVQKKERKKAGRKKERDKERIIYKLM